MEELIKLQKIGLVSQVANILSDSLGVRNTTLAEYIIHLASESSDYLHFNSKLIENEACFEISLVKHLYSIIEQARIPRARSRSPRKSIQEGSTHTAEVVKLSSSGFTLRLPDSSEGLLEGNFDLDLKQRVKVRVIRLSPLKFELCEPVPTAKDPTEYGNLTGIKIATQERERRSASPELWETTKLKAANVHVPSLKSQVEEDDDCTAEIQFNRIPPNFLKGNVAHQTKDPVNFVRDNEGDLAISAQKQATLAKERREIRELQQRETKRKTPKYDKNWEDPFAQSTSIDTESSRDHRSTRSNRFSGKAKTPIQEQRTSLPIFQLKTELMSAIHNNRILIVVGETGSGKTTQMTQYLVEHNYAQTGRIGCTQPRRMAAMSVAKRVSEEFGCTLGREVGYSIRFEDCTSQDTIIKYMTDGMLLREAIIDKMLSSYSVIMLDEAHERNIHTDVLFGVLKDVMGVRNDLKLIVTSATLEAEKFSQYFNDCPVFHIPGRSYPVDILYTEHPEGDYLEAAIDTTMQIHVHEPPGDILVFLTGQEEIDTAVQILNQRINALGSAVPKLIVLAVYSAQPSDVQSLIFMETPSGARKCVVATNIAEASLTIDGIYYVVDPGFAKLKVFSPKLGLDMLKVTPISQASAKQRAGRAGRIGPGKCYRLYTESSFLREMLPSAVPEIQRTNLANTVLIMKAMGINDLLNFDFMDPPSAPSLLSAMESLYYLGALDEEGLLTRLGRRMSEFPLEPRLSKILLTSVDLECTDEVVTIVAMLSVTNVFYRPKDKQSQADQKKARFHSTQGDHISLLHVYEAWKASRFSKNWCIDNFIQHRSIKRALDIRNQLLKIIEKARLTVKSCRGDYARVRKCIAAGYFAHTAQKHAKEGYRNLSNGMQVFIHPSSAIFNRPPQWVVYHELVVTSKEYMREVIAVDPQWLVEVAPLMFRNIDEGSYMLSKQGEKIQPLFNRFEDPNAWRLTKRRG